MGEPYMTGAVVAAIRKYAAQKAVNLEFDGLDPMLCCQKMTTLLVTVAKALEEAAQQADVNHGKDVEMYNATMAIAAMNLIVGDGPLVDLAEVELPEEIKP